MKYVTLFPKLETVHLKKDVGMLPISLGNKGMDFSIVCYENQAISEQNIDIYNIVQVKRKYGLILDFALYLMKNATKIDVLNLYHITTHYNAIWVLISKMFNSKGIVHIKLDASPPMLEEFDAYPSSVKAKIKMFVFRRFVELYTAESSTMVDVLRKLWGMDIKLLPNGITMNENMVLQANNRDIILTVGRLGTEEKATETLLEAYIVAEKHIDAPLVLVGPIEKSFKKYIEELFDSHPDLSERIIFTENIDSVDELNKFYSKAKLFVLPSRFESFGFVLLEALERGTYLLVSDKIPAAKDIGNNGKYCDVARVDDVRDFAEKMIRLNQELEYNEEIVKERNQWIKDNYAWEVIASKLIDYIQDVKK